MTKRKLIDGLDQFTRAYIGCMLWSTNDESDEAGGEPMDQNYDINDLTVEAIKECKKDCARFQIDYKDLLDQSGLKPERAGHNFWLNRNGHGSGYWDEYSIGECDKYWEGRDDKPKELYPERCPCPYHSCQMLSDLTSFYGEVTPYVWKGKIFI